MGHETGTTILHDRQHTTFAFDLSAGFNASEQREEGDDPGEYQRQREVPHDGTHHVDTGT